MVKNTLWKIQNVFGKNLFSSRSLLKYFTEKKVIFAIAKVVVVNDYDRNKPSEMCYLVIYFEQILHVSTEQRSHSGLKLI